MRIIPSNGGVVVSLDHRAPTEPHAIGTVLKVGGGVPWVQCGMRVAYPISEASEMKVDPASLDGVEGAPGAFCQSGEPSYCVVYLIDQRHIHATVHA